MQVISADWIFIERKDNTLYFTLDNPGIIIDLTCLFWTSDIQVIRSMWYETITIHGCHDDGMDVLHIINAEFEDLKQQFSNSKRINRFDTWTGNSPILYRDSWDLLSCDQKKSVLEQYPRYIIECRLNSYVIGENYKFVSRVAYIHDGDGSNPS
jgi:hypothetical protein